MNNSFTSTASRLHKLSKRRMPWLLTLLACSLLGSMAYAAQTGNIIGRVTDEDGRTGLPGVSIEASSAVLPQSRNVSTAANGRYKLALLPPGEYRVVFRLANDNEIVRHVFVSLDKTSRVDVSLGSSVKELETVTVYGVSSAADLATASLKSDIGSDLIDGLPVGQDYRDILKLIPGVQYSEDTIRGPSAGGSGQDNTYQFDGVDVSKPLFGTLGTEASTHDIDQVSVVKGGAAAVGFNRSGGFKINTVSKSGTNELKGEISYKIQTDSLTASMKNNENQDFDEDKQWIVASLGGPVIQNQLFFYGSYYAPTVKRDNSTSAYGSTNDFDSDRDEFFGKLTYAPTDNLLFNLSHRSSDREDQHRGIDEFDHPSTSLGDEVDLEITILEGSWVIGDDTNLSFKYTDYAEESSGIPDTRFGFTPTDSSTLDINNLDQQGLLSVPRPVDGEDAFNAFIQPIIDQYGYSENGAAAGGGFVGGASTTDDFDYARESIEISFDHTLYIGNTVHDLHFGYKREENGEILVRLSNGWGSITVPGGRTQTDNGEDIFYQARIQQISLGIAGGGGTLAPEIESSIESQSFEINDTIEYGDFTFNLGVLISNDELYGQGLRKNSDSISGFEVAAGNKYLMHEVDFSDMIQPRLGVTWDINDSTSIFANYALYNPAASSLPRAASWARNNQRRRIDVQFDANGNILDIVPFGSSSGKIFQDDITPREVQEFILGVTHEFDNGFSGRVHVRHRKADHFWEDTPNTARLSPDAPDNIPNELYVPNLAAIRAEIGGSSYVIAELDTGENKYWEVSFEGEWQVDNFFLRGSYVWSHYYGNFDQDNTTTANDANSFIGSSFIADGPGRYLWNNRQGDLRGDRRHQIKLYGFYQLPWNANTGVYLVMQSGQPWETWDYRPYSELTGSTSDTSRYAESAGSRKTATHWQADLNYTQNFSVWNDKNLQLRADLFNLFNRQTGYNIQNKANGAGFGEPRDYFNPRRLQLAVKLQF